MALFPGMQLPRPCAPRDVNSPPLSAGSLIAQFKSSLLQEAWGLVHRPPQPSNMSCEGAPTLSRGAPPSGHKQYSHNRLVPLPSQRGMNSTPPHTPRRPGPLTLTVHASSSTPGIALAILSNGGIAGLGSSPPAAPASPPARDRGPPLSPSLFKAPPGSCRTFFGPSPRSSQRNFAASRGSPGGSPLPSSPGVGAEGQGPGLGLP